MLWVKKEMNDDSEKTLPPDEKPVSFESPQDVIGKTIGDFNILKEIGRGGMAVVYEANQISLNRKVAIKVIPQALIKDPDYIERFKREATAAANLNHPNIVSIHGFGKFDDSYYYVMDIAEGRTLDQIMEAKKHDLLKRARVFGTDEAIKIIEQVANALSYAHQQGVIHRDLKPSNIMVTEKTNRVLITDFGLAKSTRWEKITPSASLFGTPAYMSPEQASGKKLDQRTDIYSLGAVLYEMLTGNVPFPGTNALEVIEKVKTESIIPPKKINPNIPSGVESMILKAMSKDVRIRYHNMDEFLKDLKNFRQNQEIKAFSEIARHELDRSPVRYSVTRLVFGILIVAIIVTGIYVYWYYVNKQKEAVEIDSKFQLANNYEQLAMEYEAIRVYKEIMDRYPGTYHAKLAEEKMSRLKPVGSKDFSQN